MSFKRIQVEFDTGKTLYYKSWRNFNHWAKYQYEHKNRKVIKAEVVEFKERVMFDINEEPETPTFQPVE